jgi:outer membrane protein assembly factor BamB
MSMRSLTSLYLLLLATAAGGSELSTASSWDQFLVWGSDSGTSITMSSPGFTVVDTDGDGRDDIIYGATEPQSPYRRIRFDPGSQRYFMDLSAANPYPFADQIDPQLRIVTALTPNGGLKALTWQKHSIAIYELASGRLERLSDPSGYQWPVPVCALDLNADGTKEIVVRDGLTVRVMNVTLTRELGASRVPRTPFGQNEDAICANLDADAAFELALDNGDLYEFDGYTLRKQGAVEWPSNGRPTGLVGSADIDGDGNEELFVANDATVKALDIETGNTRWSAIDVTWIRATRLVDINEDGIKDLLTASQSVPPTVGRIVAYDGRDGRELIRIPNPDTEPVGVNAGDFDGDGATEIAAVLFRPFTGPNRMYVYDAGTGALEWRSEDEGGPVTAVGSGDLDGDGQPEIVAAPRGVVGIDDIRLIAFDAQTFVRRWATTHQILPQRDAGEIQSLAIGNVQGDAAPEIVLGVRRSGVASVVIIDGATRALIRSIGLPGFDKVSAIATGDFDGDGRDEIAAVASAPYPSEYGGEAHILDGATGQVIAHGGLGTYESRRYLAVRLGDVSGDGRPDIIAAGSSAEGFGGALMVMDGFTHAVRGGVGGPGYNGLALVDVDGDGTLEIALGSSDGHIELRRGSDLVTMRTLAPCSTPVWAIAANTLPGSAAGHVFHTCEDRVGSADLRAGGTATAVSGMTGYRVGIGNVLLPVGTAAAPRIITSSAMGLRYLSPATNAAGPYIVPGNHQNGPEVFAAPRGANFSGQITFGNFRNRPARLELVEGPRYGTITLSAQGAFTYRMTTVRAVDLFTVRAVDDVSASVPMTFAILAENSPPIVPFNKEFAAAAGQANALVSGTTDLNGDDLEFTIVTAPTKGTLQFSANGNFTYTPGANATGDDTFEYFANDLVARSGNNGSVVIHIGAATPPVTPPVTPPSPPSTTPGGGGGGGGALDCLTLLLLLCLLAAGRRLGPRQR